MRVLRYCIVTRQITATNADELMEQREQSQACLGYAESRQKKTEGQKIKQFYESAFPEDVPAGPKTRSMFRRDEKAIENHLAVLQLSVLA